MEHTLQGDGKVILMPMSTTSPSHAVEIGARIQRLRRQRGLSLSELAHRAGVGKATLSGLEAGTRTNPTVETLYSIAGQLGVPLAAVLPEPVTDADADAGTLHGAAVSATLLEAFTDAGTTTELYRLRIRPGRTQTSPAHPPGTVEYLTVFTGHARVGPAGAPLTVAAGGHVRWAADVPHIYAAIGDVEVVAGLLIRSPEIRS
jgi:transcriptional regulator with XRE-family HTH domain